MAPAGRAVDRSEVPESERWNASSVFASPEAWDAAYEEAQAALAAATAYRGRLAEGPDVLADWFGAEDAVLERVGRLGVYASLAYATDSLDPGNAARVERYRGLTARVQAGLAFARPELLAVGVARLRGWVEANPRLADRGHWLERLERAAPHVREPEVEALLGELSGPFAGASQAHGILANAELPFGDAVDATGEGHEITQSTLRSLLGSSDRTLRESAWTRYADAHLGYAKTMAALLATGVRQTALLARTRGYESPLRMTLDPEALPESVVHGMLEVFRAHLGTWHRYWRAKRRLLGVESFHPWDTFAPMTPEPPAVGYDQAVAWLAEALEPLGRDYVEAMRRGAHEDRWVDRALNRGKRMGAFSHGVKGTHPFIMMSYSDDIFSASTLAHELGHSLHSWSSWRAQPRHYGRYSLFAAEVASNFNQAMLRAHLFERFGDDPAMELAIVEEAMANFYRYFFVMPTLERFELELFERNAKGEALTADLLTRRMAALFAEGYGDEVVFDPDRVGITWAQFHTHLYARFYVFQYATGIAGANALAQRILAGEPGAAEAYLGFLEAGGSRWPLDALAAAGVDLSSPAPIEAGFAVLDGLVGRLERLADTV